MVIETHQEQETDNRFYSILHPPKPRQFLTSREYQQINTIVKIATVATG